MCIASETCRANSVIKTELNNLHQAGPNKTQLLFTIRHIYVITKIIQVATKNFVLTAFQQIFNNI